MFIKEIILVSYLLCIILLVSGLTIAILVKNRKNTDLNRAMIMFLSGMMIICFYDMAIYYCDYVIGVFSDLKVLRIGNCIIAGNMYLWIRLQEQIVRREALQVMDHLIKRYLIFYMAMWMLLTIFLGMEHFYTLKWLLLATDILLMIVFLTSSIGRIIFVSTANDKISLYYMLIVTAMFLWNYVSYFWGETSVYWGNSEFIREPMDLTIIFWLIIGITSLVYVYRRIFLDTFDQTDTEESSKKDINERIEEVCMQYKLTPREKEFIELIYSGKSNKEIAEILFLSESTVKTHIYNIFRKMDVKNRVGVICIINGDVEEIGTTE